jgi:hypothetical protein
MGFEVEIAENIETLLMPQEQSSHNLVSITAKYQTMSPFT